MKKINAIKFSLSRENANVVDISESNPASLRNVSSYSCVQKERTTKQKRNTEYGTVIADDGQNFWRICRYFGTGSSYYHHHHSPCTPIFYLIEAKFICGIRETNMLEIRYEQPVLDCSLEFFYPPEKLNTQFSVVKPVPNNPKIESLHTIQIIIGLCGF